jgi:hypothetical protein
MAAMVVAPVTAARILDMIEVSSQGVPSLRRKPSQTLLSPEHLLAPQRMIRCVLREISSSLDEAATGFAKGSGRHTKELVCRPLTLVRKP